MAYVAGWSRFVRASMLDVLRQDYVRTARAKGLDRTSGDHQACPAQCPDPLRHDRGFLHPDHVRRRDHHRIDLLLAGMGRLYILALGDYDYPVAMAMLFITAVLTVIATLLQDILYTVVDPRIRFS